MKQKTMTVTSHTLGKNDHKVEHWTLYNDNDDLITSCHAYWGRDSIPSMLREINEQLDRDITKSEKLDLMVFKQHLDVLQEISHKLGARKMSFQDSDDNSELS